mmetsp:Transcript_31327/g.33657  ORF Transcript_31327/g.33657 Transcript_31327/m.33657 type:complete len:328 (-) Transcript_31327:11-994(-)
MAVQQNTTIKEGVVDVVESLTSRERGWAYQLEEALYDHDTVNKNNNNAATATSSRKADNYRIKTELYGKPSDLEIAAHAIRAKGDTTKALHRMRRLKQFKDMYGIADFTMYEDDDDDKYSQHHETERILKKFLTAYPTFIQRVGLDKYARVVIQFRLEGLRWTQPPPFNHNEEERFQALFHLLNSLQPTLDSIRRGTVWIGDLEGIGNSSEVGLGLSQRPTSEIYKGGRMLLRDSYPIKVEDIPVVDCPSGFSKVYLGVYPFLSRHFLSKLIRVTPRQLRNHFDSELLSDRLQGKKKRKETSNTRKKKQHSVIMNATTASNSSGCCE